MSTKGAKPTRRVAPPTLDIYKAVVRLTCAYGRDKGSSLGSGVVFSPSGLVITNNHVIEDSDFGTAFGEISVESLHRVDRPASGAAAAELIIRNEAYDLAVVQIIGPSPSEFIDLLKTPEVDTSLMERRIRVLGYPPLGGSTITVTRGIVSGFDEDGNLKTDAEINPGNSGGAAADDTGTFLGIPSFICAEAQGKLGFVISVNRIKEWFGTILKSGVPNTAKELEGAFQKQNLNFSGNNLDRSNEYPRILSKFAAIETLLSRNEYAESIRHIEFILNKRPRSALAYHYFGNALLGLGRYLDAVNKFRISLGYNPGHIAALGNLGVTFIHLGRDGEAIQIFEQIIQSSDNPVELMTAYNNLSEIYGRRRQTSASESYRLRANELQAAAVEFLARYKHRPNPGDKVAKLLEAMVQADIITED